MLSLDPSKSVAILIGISRYTAASGVDKLADLPAVENNINELRDIIRDKEIVGLPKDNIISIDEVTNVNKTLRTIQDYAKRAADTLIFYYSGHGLIGEDAKEFFLASTESEAARPEFSSVRMEDIRKALKQSSAPTRICIIDCCFSERALDGIMSTGGQIIKASVEIDGTFGFASAPATRPAIAPEGKRHTAFTGELIDVLRDGVGGCRRCFPSSN